MTDPERFDRLETAIEEHLRSNRSLQGTLENLLPLVMKNGSPATNRATITQNNPTPMWVCVVIVVALVVATWGRGDSERADITRLKVELNDARADIRELRGVDQELRATDNAVRAYINTGILKPKPQQAGTSK